VKALTMYECEYCKKVFKTPDKHRCKMHPELKNCFSCKHLEKFDEDSSPGSYGDSGYRYVSPVCGHSEHYEHDTEDIIDVMYHNSPRWSLNCPGWESK
jgi:hypothetical protein